MSNISLSLMLVFKISIRLFSFCMLLRKRLLGVSAVKSHGAALRSAAASFLTRDLFVRLLRDLHLSVPVSCPSRNYVDFSKTEPSRI